MEAAGDVPAKQSSEGVSLAHALGRAPAAKASRVVQAGEAAAHANEGYRLRREWSHSPGRHSRSTKSFRSTPRATRAAASGRARSLPSPHAGRIDARIASAAPCLPAPAAARRRSTEDVPEGFPPEEAAGRLSYD